MRGEVGEVQPERNLRLRRYIDIRGVWSCLHQKDNVRVWLTRSLASCLDIQSAVSVADAAVFSMTFILYFYYCLLAPTTATTVFLPLLSPPSAVVCGFGVFREPRRIDGVGDLKASLAHARTNYSGRGIFSKEIEMHPHVLAFGMPVCLGRLWGLCGFLLRAQAVKRAASKTHLGSSDLLRQHLFGDESTRTPSL